MAIQKEYVEEMREALTSKAFQDEDQFRIETQRDLAAGYFEEVEHLGKSLFGRGFKVRK